MQLISLTNGVACRRSRSVKASNSQSRLEQEARDISDELAESDFYRLPLLWHFREA
ncbi:hypothetical protein [Nostoc sp. FACHB-892]|uniref:hypothetical protein n=1 Tax=Nostoc sp. FACHB-892 TaxID=2692843 RepID=UPI0016862055|nr:hypothetical protein [Nostoc sp. FACHB-892]